MVSRSNLFRILGVGLTTVVVSCGEANFNSGPGVAKTAPVDKSGDANPTVPVDDPADPGSGASSTRFDSLLWFFQCESSPSAVPAPRTPKDVIALGNSGGSKYKRSEIDGIPVTITGKVCPAVTKRDIVFVIDISGSMIQTTGGNDPARPDGTCNRYDAVMAVVNSIAPGTSVQYSGVTFNSATVQQSTAFVSNAALMFGSQTLATVVCAAVGGTNYSAPLSSAINLLGSARSDASREVYFISDGQPSTGTGSGVSNPTINGVAQATAIKSAGATIATIMLGDDQVGNSHLRNSIASNKSSGGDKMHENVTETSKLANSLRDLAANDVKSGEIMYRPVGAPDWNKFDMTKHRVGDSFSLPAFPLVLAEVPEGVEVKFTYEDRRGKAFSGQGVLNFELE